MIKIYDKNGIIFYHGDIEDIQYLTIQANLIMIDPPYYNVVSDKWDHQWETFDQYLVWCKEWVLTARALLHPTGSLYFYGGIGERSDSILHQKLLLDSVGLYFKDWITWKKSRGMGTRKGWLYTREELLWYVNDNKNFVWNKEHQYSTETRKRDINGITRESKKGYTIRSPYKRITNVWTDISEQVPETIRAKHPTAKPYKLSERLMLLHTYEGDTVLDMFMGSGNAAITARRLNRQYVGIDTNITYIEQAITQLEKETS